MISLNYSQTRALSFNQKLGRIWSKKGGHTQKQSRTKEEIQKKDDLVRTLSKKGGHREDFVKKGGLRVIFAQIEDVLLIKGCPS